MLDDRVQRRTTALLLGERQSNIADLLASLRANGWLPVDQIQVRRLKAGVYLVVEGNRRVATLKYLYRRYQEASVDLGRLDPALFDAVPVVSYVEPDALHHLVIAGLNHISGKRRWPAINRARLMRRLGTEFGKTPDQVCEALGITKREYNLSVRTLGLIEQYQASGLRRPVHLLDVQPVPRDPQEPEPSRLDRLEQH